MRKYRKRVLLFHGEAPPRLDLGYVVGRCDVAQHKLAAEIRRRVQKHSPLVRRKGHRDVRTHTFARDRAAVRVRARGHIDRQHKARIFVNRAYHRRSIRARRAGNARAEHRVDHAVGVLYQPRQKLCIINFHHRDAHFAHNLVVYARIARIVPAADKVNENLAAAACQLARNREPVAAVIAAAAENRKARRRNIKPLFNFAHTAERRVFHQHNPRDFRALGARRVHRPHLRRRADICRIFIHRFSVHIKLRSAAMRHKLRQTQTAPPPYFSKTQNAAAAVRVCDRLMCTAAPPESRAAPPESRT